MKKNQTYGGLLTYGIPGFRLPRDITKNLTNRIKDLGIEIKTNMELGKEITIKNLKKQYQAIFIGIGASISSIYSLTDKQCSNIYISDYILRKYNEKKSIENLGNVIIIGGGNVATDSARAALRMGAKSSTIIYRRNKEKMPARNDELEAAIKDGVNIIYNTKVIEADVKQNILKRIKCIKTITTDNEINDVDNSEFYINADSVIFAIGLKPDKELLENEGVKLNENGLINIDEHFMTNIEGVFSGGDSTQNKATVCMAIRDGKNTAEEINTYIKNRKNI